MGSAGRRDQGDHLGLNASLKGNLFSDSGSYCKQLGSELGEEIGKALGEEAAAQNVNVVLGQGLT